MESIKIFGFLIYALSFSFCYFYLNKKLSTIWIFILYPALFAASIYPLKIWYDNFKMNYSHEFTEGWLKIILMSIAAFTIFNIAYGAVNIVTKSQVKFHNAYGNVNRNPVKFVMKNIGVINNIYHGFFYFAAMALGALIFIKYKTS